MAGRPDLSSISIDLRGGLLAASATSIEPNGPARNNGLFETVAYEGVSPRALGELALRMLGQCGYYDSRPSEAHNDAIMTRLYREFGCKSWGQFLVGLAGVSVSRPHDGRPILYIVGLGRKAHYLTGATPTLEVANDDPDAIGAAVIECLELALEWNRRVEAGETPEPPGPAWVPKPFVESASAAVILPAGVLAVEPRSSTERRRWRLAKLFRWRRSSRTTLADELQRLGLWAGLDADGLAAGRQACEQGGKDWFWGEVFAEERMVMLDGEELAEGGVEELVQEVNERFVPAGATPLTVRLLAAEPGYVLEIAGERVAVFVDEAAFESNDPAVHPWGVATIAPLAVINRHLRKVGCLEQIGVLGVGGEDAWGYFIDPAVFDHLRSAKAVTDATTPLFP